MTTNQVLTDAEINEAIKNVSASDELGVCRAIEQAVVFKLQNTVLTKARQGWKPIESAPKDNKRPLYLARIRGDGALVELDFDGAWEYWQESWELSHINGYCWMSTNGIEEPTHWAYQDEPLPASKSESQIVNAIASVSQDAVDAARYRFASENFVLSGGYSKFGWPVAPSNKKEWDKYIDSARSRVEGWK